MGNVYFKQQKWSDAIKFYDKSLTEHRTQDVVAKKAEVCHSVFFFLSVSDITSLGTKVFEGRGKESIYRCRSKFGREAERK